MNYAYIDSQNLNLGIRSLGWQLDYKKFRVYLKEKYKIEVAYLFIGYIPKYQNLYSSLQKDGYVLKFKSILPDKDNNHKGNVDAELVLQTVVDYYERNFKNAIIITSDSDFCCLVDFLYKNKCLLRVVSPCKEKCSVLLRKIAQERIDFMTNLETKLSYKNKKHRLRTSP